MDQPTKHKPRRQWAKLNPALLLRDINAIQRKFFKIGAMAASQPKEASQKAMSFTQIHYDATNGLWENFKATG